MDTRHRERTVEKASSSLAAPIINRVSECGGFARQSTELQ